MRSAPGIRLPLVAVALVSVALLLPVAAEKAGLLVNARG